MRRSSTTGLLGLAMLAAAPLRAQPSPMPAMPTVPVTRVIAVGTVVAPAKGGSRDTMRAEVADTVRLYLAGRIDQWFVRKDKPGVVFILNAATVEEAGAALATLPLSRAGVMRFDLIPVGPLAPLELIAGNGR